MVIMNNYSVYIHTNNQNNKKYIGLTKQTPKKRWKHDGFGYKTQPKFWNAIVMYGWNNFTHEIVATNLTAEEAGKLEKELIKKYDSINNGYNVSPGGSTTNHSPETLEKMRRSMIGKKLTQETKDKISKAKDNEKIAVRCISTDTIYESAAAAEKATNVDRSSISKCCRGIAHTAGGFDWEFVNEDLKLEYNKIKKENKNKSKKAVKCITTGKIYESVTDAARDTNSDASNITKVCNGKYKTTNNLRWEFYYDNNIYGRPD